MRKNGARSPIPWPLVAALLAAVLSALRAVYLENFGGAYTGCSGCFLLPTLAHDAWLLAFLFALLGVRALVRNRVAGMLLGATCAVLIVAMGLDLVLIVLLNQRLYLGDLVRFAGEGGANWSVVRTALLSTSGMLYIVPGLVVVAAGVRLVLARGPWRRTGLFLFAGAAALWLFAVWAAQRSTLHYIHRQYTWNLVAINLPQGRERAFSASHVQQALERSRSLPRNCDPGAASGRSVVIVITESLSAYQSALLGGPQNWLPRLDALARANHYFTRFYANGFGTDGGEIAVLTGRLPLDPPGASWYALSAFGPAQDTLPAIAHRAGYAAYHFTTEDLSFLDTGAWLKAMDFDGVEGSENPFYAGMPRGPFGAAPDAALFARFEQWLDQRSDPQPFVAVLLTVSSHPPFLNPLTGSLDAPGTFGYVDAQLADFHDRLAARGFLDHGLLLITGDHRAMTPILVDEYRRFGERAFARVPLIVTGAIDMPRVVTEAFQQADMPASLAHILGVEYCRSKFTGVFLDAAPAPAQYVVHSRGDDRNRLDVYFDDTIAAYVEEGDASRWTDIAPPDAADVAAWIDAQRLRNVTPTHIDAKP
jgi:lipoteichoic acid synthase